MAPYRDGTPSWVELNVPDIDAAAAFYAQLFGWTATAPAPTDADAGYRMFTQDGANVAGLMPVMSEAQPTAWLSYISVDNAELTTAKVRAAGGEPLFDPVDVMDLGRMAFLRDPSGAAFGIWQAKGFHGADLVNEPVSLCWTELLTRDRDAVLAFYPQVFDWTPGTPDFADSDSTYTVWRNSDGHPVAGAMEMTAPMFAPDVPAHWSVCFAVTDTDAILSRGVDLGASVGMAAMDSPIGRFGGLVDPQGAAFTVLASTH